MPDITIFTDYFGTYMKGFGNTILSSAIALVGSFLLGTIIAVFRITPLKPLQWFGTAYVEFIRNIPLLLVIFVFFYGLPSIGVTLSGFVCGTIGLTIYTAAFVAEAIRAGIMAVPKGQTEAARASGLDYMQTMRHVVLPQAIKIVIPPLSNQFINLVKNSSILGAFAGLDLMYYADQVASKTYATFDTYIFVAVLYLVLTLPLSYMALHLERKLAKAG
ncbi:putative glutamine ABC transporter permease protein GlnM [Paenibacillus konkukensis]|uniref:Glutamine ABC transporter permease protein GlnM n=1 Tax=Paenibacillus konkukensis TaxID=2020716 RepID=A0ABY4RUQ3_9BACL|nr:amino acid ABC transporter permease [Paenibacillus konkukensis]UQZ85715.1 putative glutamine ABC transporter permease protein GlnM [Paenibacillus konkukensis]